MQHINVTEQSIQFWKGVPASKKLRSVNYMGVQVAVNVFPGTISVVTYVQLIPVDEITYEND